MPDRESSTVLRQLRALFGSGTTAALTDAELLRRYSDSRAKAAGATADAETAFAVLVDRHGPMVWGVCRRALADVHEAEDAFQATFLILARRADAVKVDGSLGRWLYGVARRVAARARANLLSRQAREARTVSSEREHVVRDPETAERLAAVDEEIGRLPERYRSPIVLCHLEGLTYAGAAARLGWPAATLKGRLTRARALLRLRLNRRGLGPPGAILGPYIALEAPAGMTAVLAERTVRAASSLARTASVAGVSTPVLSLMNGVLRTMLVIRLTKVATLIALASAGTWLLAVRAPSQQVAPTQREPVQATTPAHAPSSAIAIPLPKPETLHRLLRRAAEEAVSLSRKQPDPSSWTLTTLAKAQAKSGDVAGARETFAAAVREAGGEFGGRPDAWTLWRTAHYQADVALHDDARRTLQRALTVVPGVAAEFGEDERSIHTLALIVEDQVRTGSPAEALQAGERLKAFAAEMRKSTEISVYNAIICPYIAAALAAIGDFQGAFDQAGAVEHSSSVLGQAALSAATHIDRKPARRFVEEATARMDRIESADQKYMGLDDLAEAQARIGEIAVARRLARSVGVGPTRAEYDMTDGPALAMLRIAKAQQDSGDNRGANESLREAYRMTIDHKTMRGGQARFDQIARVQIFAGDIEGALITIASLPEGSRYSPLVLIARVQAITGDHASAKATMTRALADAPDAAEVREAPSYQAEVQFAEIQAQAGNVAEAIKVLKTIPNEHDQSLGWERVAKARASAGDLAEALRLALDESKSPESRRSALEGIGQGVDDRLRLELHSRRAK